MPWANLSHFLASGTFFRPPGHDELKCQSNCVKSDSNFLKVVCQGEISSIKFKIEQNCGWRCNETTESASYNCSKVISQNAHTHSLSLSHTLSLFSIPSLSTLFTSPTNTHTHYLSFWISYSSICSLFYHLFSLKSFSLSLYSLIHTRTLSLFLNILLYL